MDFPIPSKYGNPVCGECHNVTPQKYHSCSGPCPHLVSYAKNEAASEVVRASRKFKWPGN